MGERKEREGEIEIECTCVSFTYYFTFIQYELAIITADGAEVIGPLTQDTNWDIAHYVK